MSLNKIFLIGNLGGDAETRNAGDAQVASFSVATTERWKDRNGEEQESTEWHRCEFWNPGGVLPYLIKGQQVFVEGTLRTEKYKDKDGVDKTAVKVRVLSLQLVGGKDGRQEGDAPRRPQRQSAQAGPAPRARNAPMSAPAWQRSPTYTEPSAPVPEPAPTTGSGDPEDDLPF